MSVPERGDPSATALSVEPPASIEIRDLCSSADFRSCVALQREVWGGDFTEVVASSMLKITREVSGVVAGAFAPDGVLVGFVYGISGFREGLPSHWSHMLAVRATHRGAGIGFRLKQYQRSRLLALGIREMRWTFDPLVAANAHFNLNLLGAGVESYVEDAYGDTGSGIHSLGTDRLVARWDLEAEDGSPGAGPESWSGAPLFDPHRTDAQRAEGRCRIPVPHDILALKREAPEVAARWRGSTREGFQGAFRAGYRVVGFQRGDRNGGGSHYLLRRSPGT